MKNNPVSSSLKLIFAILAAMQILPGHAQYTVNNYLFQQQAGNYTEITGGTVLGDELIDEQVFNASTTGASQIVNGAGFPIGFPFSLGGTVFTRFAVGTNGYICLGNENFSIANSVSTAFSGLPFNLPDTTAYANMLAALHADLQGQTGSSLSFKTVGTEPNRECVVQWKKFRIYLATVGIDDFNFQIRLQENGNKVVFSYGDFTMGSPGRKVSVGIRGLAYNVVHMRRTDAAAGETWATSTKSLDRIVQSDLQPDLLPAGGLQYTFYNPAQTAQDIGLDRASLPPGILLGCAGSNAEPITVRVFNYGDSAQTALPYRIQINNGSVQESSISLNPPLLKNQFRILTLNETVDLSQPGNLKIKVWSRLPGDTGIYSINDTAALQMQIFAPAPTPYPPVTSFSAFTSRGWKAFRGKNKPLTNDGRFIQGTQFQSGTIAINMPGFGGDSISDWLVSPAMQPLNNLRLKFRAAITDFDTITPLTSGIDNDEIRILISDNCGQTWNTLLVFNNSSLSGGAISNQKNGYSVNIPPVSGPFQIAVHANNKGSSPSANTYFFHLDDLTLNQGNSYDLAAKGVSIDNQNNPGCSQTAFTVKAWVKNEGDSLLSASPVQVRVNNNAPVTSNFTFNPALQQGDSAQVTFNSVTVNPNAAIKILVRTLLPSEDGFSSANDTAAIRFVYIGSGSPLQLPLAITFDNLPSGVPAGWLVEQVQGSDFKVRVRGTNSSRSLSALFFSGNSSSFAIPPTTAALPGNSQLTFDMRIKNDLAGPFNFGAADSVTASVSTNCGASWITVFKAKAGQPFGFDNFQTASVSLADFAGSSIAIRFDAVINRSDNTGAWLDIDNIGIAPGTAVSGLFSKNGVRFFPNPADDFLRVELPEGMQGAQMRIISADGRSIREQEISGPVSEISLEGIPPGMHLLEINSAGEVLRNKFVRK